MLDNAYGIGIIDSIGKSCLVRENRCGTVGHDVRKSKCQKRTRLFDDEPLPPQSLRSQKTEFFSPGGTKRHSDPIPQKRISVVRSRG